MTREQIEAALGCYGLVQNASRLAEFGIFHAGIAPPWDSDAKNLLGCDDRDAGR
jgi:hypothetical protein